MAFTRKLLLGAALVLGSAQGALAADLGNYGGGSIKDGGYAMPYQAATPSWYLRADGGYSVFDDPTMTEIGIYDLTEEKIGSTWSFGGGVGRYFGNGFRGDLTYDHRIEADAEGNLADHAASLEGVRKFGIKSDVFLANLYYDFDSGSRFTPYIGVGLGFTRNKTTEGSVETCGCTTAIIEEGNDTSVAGAAMAGFSMRLRGGEQQVGSFKDGPMTVSSGRALHLDVGYRFMYLGSVETGAIVHTGGGTTIAEDPTVDDIHSHELRVGLRYDIN
ncbi:MAG: porin family protein [Hyphomicrobium sp.]